MRKSTSLRFTIAATAALTAFTLSGSALAQGKSGQHGGGPPPSVAASLPSQATPSTAPVSTPPSAPPTSVPGGVPSSAPTLPATSSSTAGSVTSTSAALRPSAATGDSLKPSLSSRTEGCENKEQLAADDPARKRCP